MAIELEQFQLILLRRPDSAPRELANTDLAVQAGRLEVEAMTWWCPPRTMIRRG